MERIADFILSNRKTVFITAIVLSLASLYPVFNISTDFSLEGFFPENDPTISDYHSFSEEFGRDDNVIIIGLGSDELFTPKALRDIRTLADSLITIPHLTNVRSLWDAQQIRSTDGMLTASAYLTPGIFELSDVEILGIRDEMLNDPFTERLLISQKADYTAIFLDIDEEQNNFPVREQVISEMQRILEPYQEIYQLDVAGIPYFRNQYIHLLNGEIIFYISISSVLIILLLWFLFRSVRGVVIPMLIVWLTILLTLAVLQLTGGYFEVLTSSIAPILLCVGVADSVHMLAKYNDGRFIGLTRGKSLRESIIVLGSATFLTSVTTAIGFATLMTSNVIPMRTFGVYTAIGVLIAFVITIFLLPSMLPLFREKKQQFSPQGRIHNSVGSALRAVYYIALRHHKLIVIGTILLTIAAGLGITQIKVNGFVFDDVGRDSPLVQSSNTISERLSPQFPFELIIDTGRENGVYDPDFVNRLDKLQQFLVSFNEIEKSVSLPTLFEQVHKTMDPEAAALQRLPQQRELLAQYMLLVELTDSHILENFSDFTYQKARVASQAFDAGSWRMNQIRAETQNYLARHFPEENITMTGTTILVADLTDNIVYSLASSIGLAFLFISLIMARLFRNSLLVLISLIPNLMPIVFVAGIMGYFGIDIKPSTAVIFTIAFGIAVDDSIHFLARLRIETRRGNLLNKAVRITTEKTGRAIVLTSAILLVGFGTLGFSDFESTMLMGRLVCLTIFVALLADLLFLPALIYWMKPDLDSVRNIK